MKPISPTEVRRILEVTDKLGIHREGVVIPLAKDGLGGLRIVPGGKLEITAPEEVPFDEWLGSLPTAVSEVDLGRVKKAEPESRG
jgi:hypothetical protein